jgi:hypothetical protein
VTSLGYGLRAFMTSPTGQAAPADAAIETACRVLHLPTVRQQFPN